MSALPNPEPGDRRDLVTRFVGAYHDALDKARRSAEHTATDGWAELLDTRKEKAKAARCGIAKTLSILAAKCEDFGLNEEDEKAVKDAMKASEGARSIVEAFEAYTVEPVLEPARVCQRLISDAMAEAERTERAAPLIHVGLVDILKFEISKLPKAVIQNDRVLISAE